MSNVEQTYRTRFELLLNSGLASPASISASLDILEQVEQHTGITLDEAIGAPLATHLAVTILRLLGGEYLQPAPDVLWQELQDYPTQVELANFLVAHLEKRLNIHIPKDETGFIAMHLARIALEAKEHSETANPPTREEQ